MATELSMNGRKKIETIQKEFTSKFPYLTLVFLDDKRQTIDISKSLSEVRKVKGDDVSIIASLKINTLEKRFLDNFGIIVEVAYQKQKKLIFTKDNLNLTLNELNKWCSEHNCEKFKFTKSLTGNTILSIQDQLLKAIKEIYPNAIAKKINKDNYLDIYIPEFCPTKGTHFYFNIVRDDIKIGFYTRDEEFKERVLSKSNNIESYSQGLRIQGNPTYKSLDDALEASESFILQMIGKNTTSITKNEFKDNSVDNDKKIEVDEEQKEDSVSGEYQIGENIINVENRTLIMSDFHKILFVILSVGSKNRRYTDEEIQDVFSSAVTIGGIWGVEKGDDCWNILEETIESYEKCKEHFTFEQMKEIIKELCFDIHEMSMIEKDDIIQYITDFAESDRILESEEASDISNYTSFIRNGRNENILELNFKKIISLFDYTKEIDKISLIIEKIFNKNDKNLINELLSYFNSKIDNYNNLSGFDAYIYCRLLNDFLIGKSIKIHLDDVIVPLINTGVLTHSEIGEIDGYFKGHWNEIVDLNYEIDQNNIQIFFDDLKKIVTQGEILTPNSNEIDWDFQTYEVYADSFFTFDNEKIDVTEQENVWDNFVEDSMEHAEEQITIMSDASISFDFLLKDSQLENPDNLIPEMQESKEEIEFNTFEMQYHTTIFFAVSLLTGDDLDQSILKLLGIKKFILETTNTYEFEFLIDNKVVKGEDIEMYFDQFIEFLKLNLKISKEENLIIDYGSYQSNIIPDLEAGEIEFEKSFILTEQEIYVIVNTNQFYASELEKLTNQNLDIFACMNDVDGDYYEFEF